MTELVRPVHQPRFKTRQEIEQARQDPDKVPYSYYASHPEHRPQQVSRWRGPRAARRRAIRGEV